jgi:hypothetical protein
MARPVLHSEGRIKAKDWVVFSRATLGRNLIRSTAIVDLHLTAPRVNRLNKIRCTTALQANPSLICFSTGRHRASS